MKPRRNFMGTLCLLKGQTVPVTVTRTDVLPSSTVRRK